VQDNLSPGHNERSVIVETLNGSTDNMGSWVQLMWNTFLVAWKFCYHVVTDECMSLKDWWNSADRAKPKCLKKISSHYHFIHHKSHVNWPQIERMPLWWQTGNLHPEPWHSPKFVTRKSDRFSIETHKEVMWFILWHLHLLALYVLTYR